MLTDKKVRELKPGNYRVGDKRPGDDPAKAVSGFGVRVLPSGVKTFYLDYRVGGVARRPVIASWPNWTVAQARAEARRWRQLIESGRDPHAERETVRTAPTVAQLAGEYLERHARARKRPGSTRNDEGMIERWIVPTIGNQKAAALRAADVEALHAKVSRTGARTHANRVVALLATMLQLAIRWGHIERNVARGAVERNPEVRRRRYLRPDEIVRLSAALAECSSQAAADAIRLLLLTGARRNEVCAMRWRNLDLAAGEWVKPGSTTKQRTDHHVPLSPAALEILARRRVGSSPLEDYVFPGRDGEGFLNVRTTWENARKAAGLDDVHLHDLRHSFASILVSSGASLPLIGALLGHSNPQTTARYSHLALDPLREAVERVGAVVAGGGRAEVVPLARKLIKR